MSIRPVIHESHAMPTMEGAGVHLHRAFGFKNPEQMDPFLLFDDFRNERPEQYNRGFPWHPHRGIETITYVLAGSVDHGDSLGNSGTLRGGDVQWMTAGSGILHQEMPKGNAKGQMHGFQLWANLPSALKMTTPRYQDVKARDIPEILEDDGSVVKVIVGTFWGKTGRLTAFPPIRNILTSSCLPDGARPFPSIPAAAALPMCSTGRAAFAMPAPRAGCCWKRNCAGKK